MLETWLVLLEAAGDDGMGAPSARQVHDLLQALDPGPWGSALDSPGRYALQVATTASSPGDALVDVLSRWTGVVRDLGLPMWRVVRTEVLTPEEFERDFRHAERADVSIRSAAPESGGEHDEIAHELIRQAFSDPLTGLLHRDAFAHRLQAALDRDDGGRRAAVVCVDLDGFGTVNLQFGDATGDEVLVAVAQRLAAVLRPADVLARFGGDDYAVLLEDTNEEAGLAVAARMLEAVRRPIGIRGQDLTSSASAGVALADAGDDAQTVVAKAQAALALARASGGGRPVLHTSGVPQSPQIARDLGTRALQDRLAHLVLTQEAAVASNQAQTLHDAADVVMRQICALVGCDGGHLWISPATAEDLALTPLWHVGDAGACREFQNATEKLPVRPGVGLVGRVLSTGRPVWIADLSTDADLVSRAEAVACRLQSVFAFPVLVGSEVVAVLEFFSRARIEPTASFLDVLAGIGTQLGRVVERQRAAAAMGRSQEQLGASERRLQEAQAMAHLGSWQFDLRTGESRWSQGMDALLGLEPGQGLDLGSAVARVHPDDRDRAEAALSWLVESGEPTADEVRIVRADGQVRWHHVHGSAIRDDNGAIVGIRGTSQDITERKEVEEALRERERRLTEAQRAARLGWWERELTSGRVTWSEEMYRLWGRDPGETMSFEAFLATVHGDDRPRLLEEAARLRRTGEPVCLDFRAVVADGRQRWLKAGAQVLRDEHGRPVKLFGTVQDVTDQTQAQEELRRAKDSYQRIVETAHEGILTVDAQNVTTFANPRMAQILGYSVDEMIGMPASMFVDEETFAALASSRARRRAGMSENYETQLRAKDGSIAHVRISASPFLDEHGRYAGALAMVTDVTALREAEEIVRSRSEGLDAT